MNTIFTILSPYSGSQSRRRFPLRQLVGVSRGRDLHRLRLSGEQRVFKRRGIQAFSRFFAGRLPRHA
ncbi:MAG: hypothetical protein IIT69_00050, partial [Bacteroidales bacterium]|nr:hypothetical protein [Bacteroidales bacterium]